jgi:hypothetical protein
MNETPHKRLKDSLLFKAATWISVAAMLYWGIEAGRSFLK